MPLHRLFKFLKFLLFVFSSCRSAIEVKNNLTPLDLMVDQVEVSFCFHFSYLDHSLCFCFLFKSKISFHVFLSCLFWLFVVSQFQVWVQCSSTTYGYSWDTRSCSKGHLLLSCLWPRILPEFINQNCPMQVLEKYSNSKVDIHSLSLVSKFLPHEIVSYVLFNLVYGIWLVTCFWLL